MGISHCVITIGTFQICKTDQLDYDYDKWGQLCNEVSGKAKSKSGGQTNPEFPEYYGPKSKNDHLKLSRAQNWFAKVLE